MSEWTALRIKEKSLTEPILAHTEIREVEAHAKKRWGGLAAEDDKKKTQFVLLSFPEWKVTE